MSPIQEAMQLRSQLMNEWKAGGRAPNLEKCGELLNRIKVVFDIGYLYFWGGQDTLSRCKI